jgi:CheY-like chemotaxis protein
MESIGRLAGGVAHDFNNMLTVINAYATMAMMALPPDSTIRDDLAEVVAAGNRATVLTRQLLAFSRQQVLRRAVVSLDRVVGNVQGMLRRLIGEHIALEFAADRDLAPVLVDPSQIEQVVMNLAVNARDAMPTGGTLTLRTENVTIDDARAKALGLAAGAYVRLTVSDTGIGMDEATRSRAFEPFFTTKEEGKGTGLGLSMVHGIVAQSGGAVSVRSYVGMGSTFEVYLPVHRGGEIDEAPAPASSTRVASGHETVLVVEDDEAVRALVQRVLRASGYSVLAAADGAEAIALAQHETRPIHLLLTDIVMPRSSGVEVASRLQATRPGLKVVYMSGHTADAFGGRFEVPAGSHFVPKPLVPDELTRTLRDALRAR